MKITLKDKMQSEFSRKIKFNMVFLPQVEKNYIKNHFSTNKKHSKNHFYLRTSKFIRIKQVLNKKFFKVLSIKFTYS